MGIRKQGWFVLASLAAAAAPVAEAGAQRISPREVERGVTVDTRPRPDFDPLGVRFGGFRLDGSAEAGIGWDSNVFGRERSVVSDGYVSETAFLSLGSDWTRHAFGATATLDARQYFSRSDINWTDWSLGGFGRYDFSAFTNVEGRYRHSRSHLDVFNFDVQSAGLSRPVPFDTDEFQVSGATRFNRLGLLATGTYQAVRFDSVDFGEGPTDLSTNDFNSLIGSLAASYTVAPGRNVLGVVRLQDIDYTSDLSRDRDSFSWTAQAGFQYDFDGVWQARLTFGWQQRNYQGARLKNLEGPAFEGTLTYAPTQLTTLSLNIARSIEESIRQDAVSYQRTTVAARLDHEYLRNVILGVELRVDRREYDSPNQTATDGQVGLTARYLLNRSMSVVGSYAYARRLESSGGINEYDRNLIQVRLRFAL